MSDAEWLAVLVTVVGALVVGTWLAVQSDRRRSGASRPAVEANQQRSMAFLGVVSDSTHFPRARKPKAT